MRFEIGDSVDSDLCTAIVHEYLRCKDCFELFQTNAQALEREPSDKNLKIRSYNLYTDFLIHLYEFYLACFKRDRHSTDKISPEHADSLINFEAQKAVNGMALLIRAGQLPEFAPDVDAYEVTVPASFAVHFRRVRNQHSHVDFRRSSGKEICLSEFFAKYHFYIYNLYAYPYRAWIVKDIEKYNFKEMENFQISVSKHHIDA